MAINSVELQEAFRRVLGRAPRPDEMDFFIRQAKDNDLSAFEIGEVLQGSPEAQRSLARQDVADYGRFFEAQDRDFLGRAQNQLEAKFRGQGRSASGSHYIAAYLDAAQKLALARSSQLGDLYRSRVEGAAGTEAGQGAFLRQRGYGLADERRQRAYALEDFYMQRDLYNDQRNAVNRMRRQQAFGALGGAALGAGLGAAFGGGQGALYGSQIGGNLGGLFG